MWITFTQDVVCDIHIISYKSSDLQESRGVSFEMKICDYSTTREVGFQGVCTGMWIAVGQENINGIGTYVLV